MKKQTNREKIYAALKTLTCATSRQISKMTGFDEPTTHAGIHYLISKGEVFRVGHIPAERNKKFVLYSVISPLPEEIKIERPTKQTWLSPLM